MEYKYHVVTLRHLEQEQFLNEATKIINYLRKYCTQQVEIYFGFGWNLEVEVPFDVYASKIMETVKEKEKQYDERFGENDVFVTVTELETNIVFHHEAELHIEFNVANRLVRDILAGWEERDILSCAEKDSNEVDWPKFKQDVLS